MKPSARIALLIAIPFLTGIAVGLTLFAFSCPGTISTEVPLIASKSPRIGLAHFDVPKEAKPETRTQVEMHNVLFHVDPTISLRIHSLRGEMYDKTEGRPLNFDDKRTFIVRLVRARIGVSGQGLTDLLNHYVFRYEGAPIRNLAVRIHEGRLVQRGIMHKGIDIPFEMTAVVSTTNDGWIRIHPVDLRIRNLVARALMKLFNVTLEKALKNLPAGVRVEKNDLLIDPLAILPPPSIAGRLTGVELHENELVQIFQRGPKPDPLVPSDSKEPNWMLYRGGTLRMGKLFMVHADMFVVDTDPRDPFDFFVDYYNHQLVGGFTRNQPDYALKVFMRDFADVGKPPQPGERLAPH